MLIGAVNVFMSTHLLHYIFHEQIFSLRCHKIFLFFSSSLKCVVIDLIVFVFKEKYLQKARLPDEQNIDVEGGEDGEGEGEEEEEHIGDPRALVRAGPQTQLGFKLIK